MSCLLGCGVSRYDDLGRIDYTESLDAIAPVEAKIFEEGWSHDYGVRLADALVIECPNDNPNTTYDDYASIATAPASVRAEACRKIIEENQDA